MINIEKYLEVTIIACWLCCEGAFSATMSNGLSSRTPAMTIEYAFHREQNFSTVMVTVVSSLHNGSDMHLASMDTVITAMSTSDKVYSHEHTVKSPGIHDFDYVNLPGKLVFVIALSCIVFIIIISIIVLLVLRWRQNRLRKTVLNIIYTPASVRTHRNSTQSLLGNDEVDDGTSDNQLYLRLHSYE